MNLNNGIIHSNSACIGCNRCITACPVPGAHVTVRNGDKLQIEIDDDKCIHGGYCMSVCPHGAIGYDDDTEAFFAALAAHKPVAVALDPTFSLLYPRQSAGIMGYLRASGVSAIYDVSFGADIYTWAAVEHYDKHPGQSFVYSGCPPVISLVEKFYPSILDYLLPLQSPLRCMTTYIEKYLHDTTDIAYIGPCVAKKSEFGQSRLKYHVTYRKLFQYLQKHGVDLAAYRGAADLKSPGMGYLYAMSDGLKDTIGYYMAPGFDIHCIDSFSLYSPEEIENFFNIYCDGDVHSDLVGLRNCRFGCHCGQGSFEADRYTSRLTAALKSVRQAIMQREDYEKSREERKALLRARFARLDPADFARTFTNRYKQPFRLPPDVLDQVFIAMNKTTVASRRINCGFCGYPTCLEMARAVGKGFSVVENCIHYMRNETQRLYATDALTGIPNWNAFKRNTKELLWNNEDKAYAMAYFDIKNFKMVNDLYGFATGDRTLKMIARRIQAFAGDRGTCARIMSDRFILCMPDGPEIVQQLIDTIQYNVDKHDLDFPISFDLGFYRIEDRTLPFEVMMDRARLAQLSIKGSYEVRWAYFDEAMHNRLRNEAWVTKEMARALAEGQFLVFLQPQYDHRTRKMTGAEALVRWLHPHRGMIAPSGFIETFEKNHFIRQVDAFVREQTCRLLREWLDEGLPVVPVSVNLSRIDLYDEGLPASLGGLMRRYGLHRDLLRLEITESAYTEEPQQLIDMITKLQEEGFLVEMDDFGSGYSSLNTLHDMPVDLVKLDLRFLTGHGNQKGRNIILSIVQMMRRLHLPIIAEGVETKEQADFMVRAGCPLIQGYYYARPLSVEEFVQKMKEDSIHVK